MYLTRGILSSTSRDVLRDLADPVALHRSVLRMFPDEIGTTPRASVGALHRIDTSREGRALLVVQSSVRPEPDRLPAGYFAELSEGTLDALGMRTNPIVDERAYDIARGARFRFRLRANTTRKIDTKTGPDGRRRNGKRVPVRGDEERMRWLARRGDHDGFRVLDASVREEKATNGRRRDAGVTVAGAHFEGVLEVLDEQLFGKALVEGIGPAKAYGFGLLSIAPIR